MTGACTIPKTLSLHLSKATMASTTKSTIDPSIPPLKPFFDPQNPLAKESASAQAIIDKLGLQSHVEGGYFVETDRDKMRIPNPFQPQELGDSTRAAMTTIHYYLTPKTPLGAFHRNKGRTVHTLHKGRGRYVIIHADEAAAPEFPGGYPGSSSSDDAPEEKRWKGKARVETFVVGQDIAKGERLQWIVDGGKYKGTFVLPDEAGGKESKEGLLISEVVVPGFEFADHDFMRAERLTALVTSEQREEVGWMLRKV
jgi:uncharacterized protein